MSDTLRKAALIEACVAVVRRMRGGMRRAHSARPWRMRWTPAVAAAAVFGALLFAWAFLRIVLILVFPIARSH